MSSSNVEKEIQSIVKQCNPVFSEGGDFFDPEKEKLRINRLSQLWYSDAKKNGLILTDEQKTELLRQAKVKGDNRLVQGCKSPTLNIESIKRNQIGRLFQSKSEQVKSQVFDNYWNLYEMQKGEDASVFSSSPQPSGTPKSPVLKKLSLFKRDWSGQYKAQVITMTPPSKAPDINAGERFTERLTPASVTKIFEAGAYVATCHDGFSTFLTLTFNAEQRAKLLDIETGEILDGTIGKEVSRFLDSIKKIYHRGFWAGDEFIDGHKENGKNAPFHYIWVAEAPKNKDAEPNPHVHLLLKWTVEPRHFKAWAERLEKVWGKGFAHIERIKQAKGASKYLIKAVGYSAKGSDGEQGLIRGNRYNIARCSRAPKWEHIATFHAENMTAIIKELGQKLDRWRKPIERSMARINAKKKNVIVSYAIAKKKSTSQQELSKLKQRIIKLERSYLALINQKKSRGVYARSNNRFCVTFESTEKSTAEDKVDDFLLWAVGARDFNLKPFNQSPSIFDGVKKKAREIYKNQREAWRERCAYMKSLHDCVLEENRFYLSAQEYEKQRNRDLSNLYEYLTT